MKFGFIRETQEQVDKSPIDKETGLPRTCILDYLKVIFPNTNDWIHDKCVPNSGSKCRPDYRSESLKMIVEIDGLPHYQSPDIILSDESHTKLYQSIGYKVVRIPFFIQLTNSVAKQLFSVEVQEQLFIEGVPSFTVKGRATPAFMCPLGIERCRNELKLFPEQYLTNMSYLRKINSKLSGYDFIN